MTPYIGQILTAVLMLGGLAALHSRVMARLTKMETRWEICDDGAADRVKLRAGETHKIVRAELRRHVVDCPEREVSAVRARLADDS